MTADTLPRTAIEPAARLRQVNREIGEIDQALANVRGWGEQLQDSRRKLRIEKAELLGVLGRNKERLDLLRELALES